MGFKLAERAMRNTTVTGPAKTVLIVLALKADDQTGELFPSQETIAEASGVSVASVRRALDRLEEASIIRRERRKPRAGYRATDLITVDGEALDSYPSESTVAESYRSHSNELPLTQQKTTAHSERYIKGLSFNDQSVDQSDSWSSEHSEPVSVHGVFADFWTVWPRKVSKPQAEKAWVKAIRRAPPEAIIAAAAAYAANPHRPPTEFIPHAATWLGGDRWNDELPGPRTDAHRRTPNQARPDKDERALSVIEMGQRMAAAADAGARREVTA